MRMFLIFVCLIAINSLAGCASFSTNMIHRSEDDSGWCREKHLRGIPVTLKVQTHLKIDVLEKNFLVLNQSRDEIKTAIVTSKQSKIPMRTVQYTPIETEQIFLVDLKRPGAGTIDANIDLDADAQYFKEIKTQVEDKTIDAVGNLVAGIAKSGLLGKPTSEGGGVQPGFGNRVKVVTKVVASKVFEIDAPNFEVEVADFLNEHLNCCHTCLVSEPFDIPTSELPFPVEKSSIRLKLKDDVARQDSSGSASINR